MSEVPLYSLESGSAPLMRHSRCSGAYTAAVLTIMAIPKSWYGSKVSRGWFDVDFRDQMGPTHENLKPERYTRFDVDFRDQMGRTPLMAASHQGHLATGNSFSLSPYYSQA